MDRNSIIGFTLITVVLIVWIYMTAPQPQPQAEKPFKTDTIVKSKIDTPKEKEIFPENKAENVLDTSALFGVYFQDKTIGRNDVLTIETDKYVAKISTKGGTILEWKLKEFKTFNGFPVQLIPDNSGGDLNLLLSTTDGKLVNTKSFYFKSNFVNNDKVILKDGEEYPVDLVLNFNDGKSKIIKRFIFKNGKYSFKTNIVFENMQGILSGPDYQLLLENHLKLTEGNTVDEAGFAYAHAMYGDELIELDGNDFENSKKDKKDGNTKWVASRNKYFAHAIIALEPIGKGYYLEGKSFHLPNSGIEEKYNIGIKMPFDEKPKEESSFEVYMGPANYEILKTYDVKLDKIVSLGLEWLIRPIAVYFLLPLLKLVHYVIPNWGLVIVVFTLIIRILLHPLNKSQMKSMQKMQALQPMITELKEKHKDDPTKVNAQTLKLYQEYGVNPAGGCLPLILQMPILFALFSVFRNTIELRQAGFFLWITDLSIPDVIVTLPFKLPLFGMDSFSGLAILMGITMFIQQKMTVKDPRQAAMVYVMPIMFTLMFNSFPSGLNLYYFLFNLFSIIQQFYTTKIKKQNIVLEKVPVKKKKGFLDKLTHLQQAQQQTKGKKK